MTTDTGARDVAIAGIGATPYYKRGETAGQSRMMRRIELPASRV